MKNTSYKPTFLSIITFSTLCFASSAFAKQITVVVAPKSLQVGSDGISFKSIEGNEYSYVYQRHTKDAELISKKKSTVCLTIDTANDDNVTSIANGECKTTQDKKSTNATIDGTYTGKAYDGGKTKLHIKSLGNDKVSLNISTVHGAYSGSIDDATASLEGNVATFMGEDSCKLVIEFKGREATVAEESCSYYHGMQSTFDGVYLKKK